MENSTPLIQTMDSRYGCFSLALIGSESFPVTADGLVLIGSHSDRLQAIHSITGLKVWEHKTNNHFNAPAIVGPDGTIFVGNNSNKILCP